MRDGLRFIVSPEQAPPNGWELTCGARCGLRLRLRFLCCLQEPVLRLALNLDCTLSLQKTQRGAEPAPHVVVRGQVERPVRLRPFALSARSIKHNANTNKGNTSANDIILMWCDVVDFPTPEK